MIVKLNTRTRILLSGLMIAMLSYPIAGQNRKLYPVDEAAKDSTFKAFRDQLLTAARKKDKKFILSIIDPKIQLSFGGHAGVEDFKKFWKINDPNSKFWNELMTVLKMGGSFETVDGQKEFVAPYVSSKWPDDSALDAFEYVAVIGTNVRLRDAPGLKSSVVATLDYDIVKLNESGNAQKRTQKDGFKWVKVTTAGGQQGYIADKYIRSPIDYRAYFRKVKGSWLMTIFIAGD